MDEKTKQYYEGLKNKQKRRNKNIEYMNNTLLQECLKSLEDKAYELTETEEKDVFELFGSLIPMNEWGGIDWNSINNYEYIDEYSLLSNFVNNNEYYILWGHGLPILRCDLSSIISNIEDITAVDFDTWLLSTDYSEIIENHHEGIIRYGKLK